MGFLVAGKVVLYLAASLLLISCTATGSSTSLPSPAQPSVPAPQTRTPTIAPAITSIPTPTLPNRIETTTFKVHFDTYETEETIGAELSRVNGVIGIIVTQSQITITFDPLVINRAEIIKVINKNPEVRLEEP